MEKFFDKNLIGIATRYAKALTQTEANPDILISYQHELENFLEIYKKSDDLRMAMTLPTVENSDKKAVLSEILKDDFSNTVKNLMYLLVDENRFNIFETFVYCLEEEINKIKRVSKVEIQSVVDIPEDMKYRLEEKLRYKLQKDIIINYEKNEDILGGLLIKFEGKTIDLSIKSQLDDLKRQLI